MGGLPHPLGSIYFGKGLKMLESTKTLIESFNNSSLAGELIDVAVNSLVQLLPYMGAIAVGYFAIRVLRALIFKNV